MPSFNVNGPKAITMETFHKYQQLRPENGAQNWSIETLFQYAIDENHPTDLRLLAWRDLLFQTGSTFAPEASYFCHDTKQWYPNILHIGGGSKDGKALREAFRGRPRLVNEFADQLEYNLRHDLMHRKIFHDGKPADCCDKFIEILLPLVSDTMARKLWKYHTFYNFAQKPPTYETALEYIKLCQPKANLPRWLTGTIKTTVITLATSEAKDMRSRTETRRIDHNDYDCITEIPVISAIVCQLHHFDRKKQIDLITDYTNYLERTLPQNYLYFDFFDLQRYAPIIQDELTAFRLLNRHIPPLQDSKFVSQCSHPYSKETENFLMWIYGFTHCCSINPHTHSLESLARITLDIHSKAKSSSQFRGY